MRSPSVHESHQTHPDFNPIVNNQLIAQQHEQIELNKQLLISREECLESLKGRQQRQIAQKKSQVTQSTQEMEYHEMKSVRLRSLHNQINQEKVTKATFENDLDVLKHIFFNKQKELTKVLNKTVDLAQQLDQFRKIKVIVSTEQTQNQNELDKLKQELAIRNQLNEQHSRQIVYQRDLFSRRQAELNQIEYRIENLQQHLKQTSDLLKANSATVESSTLPDAFRAALDSVQDTLSHINIAEIEQRMVQLVHSFNSINNLSNESETGHSNVAEIQACDGSTLASPAKIAFASKSDIAAAYLSDSLTKLANTPNQVLENFSSKPDEQLFPPNLRLNDDILSVHFNNVTSSIKKRHSLCETSDSLLKQLSSNVDSGQQQQPIQVQDDSGTVELLPSTTASVDCFCAAQQPTTLIESFMSDTESEGSLTAEDETSVANIMNVSKLTTHMKSLLKTSITFKNHSKRVIFDPLALLLDAAATGELELVIKSAKLVKDPSQPNDEGLTALHNAVCASKFECVKFLVEFGCDINYADNDGWTPLHCAASCNNTFAVMFLIEHGACIYATTARDHETAAEKCEETAENYMTCSQCLLAAQNDLGIINHGLVYAVYDYDPVPLTYDELAFKDGDSLIVLRRGDENETEWWWARHESTGREGYIPRNYLGLYPRVRPGTMLSAND